MTKAVAAGLVKGLGLALDLVPRRITVNNIQPGPTETDITAGMAEHVAALSPQQRIAQPQEIASLLSWLAGSESGYRPDLSLTIDGELTAWAAIGKAERKKMLRTDRGALYPVPR